MQWLREFLEQKKWKQLKKSDWAVLALVGVLLLVIAIPLDSDKKTNEKSTTSEEKDQQKSEEAVDEKASNGSVGQTAAETGGRSEEYVTYLENKLEEVLSQMDGVGRVEVMITVSDGGESVVEKDRASTATTTTENDSAGGSRTISEQNTEEQTIYVETENETYPYVQKENLPTVIGVVVVAEGGGNSTVISDISEAVEALLPVEAHRIKVVKMCSKED